MNDARGGMPNRHTRMLARDDESNATGFVTPRNNDTRENNEALGEGDQGQGPRSRYQGASSHFWEVWNPLSCRRAFSVGAAVR